MKGNPRPVARTAVGLALWLALSLASASCLHEGPPPTQESNQPTEPPQPPAMLGAKAPYLLAAEQGGLWLSWLEPLGEEGHRLVVAAYRDGTWGAPTSVVQGEDFFANWADTPVLAQHPNGTLLIAWLARLGEGTYAYGIQLAASDDGVTWRRLGSLHPDDRSPMEHGFMSFAPEGDGFRAFWLDGRDHAEHGMQLRTARVHPASGAGPSEIVDDLVCDCCPTAAAAVDGEVLVAYRDRTPDEIRDIVVANLAGDSTELGAEGWNIAGCPVNGPAIVNAGSHTFAAWFTAAEGLSRVRAAWRESSSLKWSPPVEIAAEGALGRVDVTLDGESGEGIVSWLETDGENGRVMMRRVQTDGGQGAARTIGEAESGRSSGIPRTVWADDGHLYTVWTTARGLAFAGTSQSDL